MFYIHRYIRLTIPYAFVIASVIILPLIASGPILFTKAQWSCEGCKQYWWQNLLYINNFGDLYDNALSCLGMAWYLCCDMIFYWFALPIIYPMWKFWRNKPVKAVTWIGLILAGFTIARIYVTWELETDRYEYHHMPAQYVAPWHRCQPYLLGILLGYALHKTKGKPFEMNSVLNILLWQASFLLAFAIVYGIWDWNQWPTGPKPTSTALRVAYYGLMRLVWPLSLVWPIFACCSGFGGLVNDFLSWKAFIPLSKLTYLAYLLHMEFVIDGISFNINFTLDISLWLMVGLFLGTLVITMALAFGLTLAFEIPFIKLDKLVFGILLGKGKKNHKMEPT